MSKLVTDAAPIIGALMVIGFIIKNAFPNFNNRFIPLITWLVGAVAYVANSGDHTINGVITGVMVSAVATGLHSGIKNTMEPKDETPAAPPAEPEK